VEIARRRSHPIRAGVEAAARGHVDEAEGPGLDELIAEQPMARSGGGGMVEVASLDKEEVEVAVAVGVEQRQARPHDLRHVEVASRAAAVHEVDAELLGALLEPRIGGRSRRGRDGGENQQEEEPPWRELHRGNPAKADGILALNREKAKGGEEVDQALYDSGSRGVGNGGRPALAASAASRLKPRCSASLRTAARVTSAAGSRRLRSTWPRASRASRPAATSPLLVASSAACRSHWSATSGRPVAASTRARRAAAVAR